MRPIRQGYLTVLLIDTGFALLVRYGDFREEYEMLEPDFIAQAARKS